MQSAEAAARIFRRQFPEDAGEELAGVEDQVAAQLAQRAQRDEMRRQQRESRRQARRRQVGCHSVECCPVELLRWLWEGG